MPIDFEMLKPQFREVERIPEEEAQSVEDLRTLWRGDSTEHWFPKEPVAPKKAPRVKEALRGVMSKIISQLPDKLTARKPQEVASGENECIYRINGVHRHVIPFNAVITLRYWPKTSTLEAEVLMRDGVYNPADRYTDRYTFAARTREETEDLIYQMSKYLRSRVPW
jgi:hypothetical protein